jgi:hypothetical protein
MLVHTVRENANIDLLSRKAPFALQSIAGEIMVRARGRPKRTTQPEPITTVQLKRGTHARLMSYAGKLQVEGGMRASVDAAVKKLLDKT